MLLLGNPAAYTVIIRAVLDEKFGARIWMGWLQSVFLDKSVYAGN